MINRNVYSMGYNSARNGFDASVNPFNSESSDFLDWDIGHADGMTDNATEACADEDVDEWDASEEDYDDSMDGDAESAFDSIGWGCDESYEHYDEY